VEDALFHCQQAAEKALKAFLTFHDRPFRKTHDLASLGKQCADIDATLEGLVERLDDLSEYAWAYRYPTGCAEPAPGDIEDARRAAQEAIQEIARRLPGEVQEAVPEPLLEALVRRAGSLRDVERLFTSGEMPVDVAFVQASPPDPVGRVCLGGGGGLYPDRGILRARGCSGNQQPHAAHAR
jgi:HEPN domain-containing protein